MPSIKVNGHDLEWEEGMTVRRVLAKMNYTFPMLVIKIDGRLVKKEDWETAEVPSGADVSVYHLISGG
ncbi:MAG: sulfur carrier protein ThiS [Candidatus Syntrophosphaera sp.]|nr:sulfur carrier protein ThiS [Candidatus Syntrophosphaera sp.]